MNRERVKYSIGNDKVGPDTIIINMTSAHDCPSLALGLCQVPVGKCYAFRDELRWKDPLGSRREQARLWDLLTAEEIADDIRGIVSRRRSTPIKFVRFSESGDFRDLADVDKMNRIADLLAGTVRCYTYTARHDLFGEPIRISANLVVNGSGFMVDNSFQVVSELQRGPRCRGKVGGGCYGCMLCKAKGGKIIQEILR